MSPSASRGWYSFVDRAAGSLLMSMLVASPWLFGTTEQWSIWTMNVFGYAIGILLGLKWLFRWRTGAVAVEEIWRRGDPRLQPGDWMVRSMAFLTVAVLFYCLVSALNARASFLVEEQRFEYYGRYVPWLPFSYDRALTWQAFWNYLSLACFFWGLRDWLIHPPRKYAEEAEVVLGLPRRFRILFWVVALNSTLLAVQGVFQQLDGTDRLLWLRPGKDRAPHMFGPFAFRGNAAQYLNLAWPAMLGFWWVEREKARVKVWDGRKVGGGAHMFLLLCVVLTASAPMIAGSHGGALVNLALLAATLLVFLVNRHGTWRTHCAIALVCLSIVALGGALGWDQLAPRLRAAFRTPYANPSEVYENAKQMALDYPLFGIGPGAFRALYPMYRANVEQSSHAFLHDDWLEMRVTFGWVGSMLILTLLGLALTRWFLPGGVFGRWELVSMLWIAVAGCLAHAKFGFPLQVYSILTLLLAHMAVLSSLSRPDT